MLAPLFDFFENLDQRMQACEDGMLERTRAYFERVDAKATGISPIITSAELRSMAEPYKGKRFIEEVEDSLPCPTEGDALNRKIARLERSIKAHETLEASRRNNTPTTVCFEPELEDMPPLSQALIEAGITHEILDCFMVHQWTSYLITLPDLFSASQEKILEHVLNQTRKELAPHFEAWVLPDMMPNIPEGTAFERMYKRQLALRCLTTKGFRYFPDCRRKDVYHLRLLAMMA